MSPAVALVASAKRRRTVLFRTLGATPSEPSSLHVNQLLTLDHITRCDGCSHASRQPETSGAAIGFWRSTKLTQLNENWSTFSNPRTRTIEVSNSTGLFTRLPIVESAV